MKIVIDMNLSPTWAALFEAHGWEAVHWSTIGAIDAPDHEIMDWAMKNQAVVLTHDLDFGAILAATRADAPSVLQVRTQNVDPHVLHDLVVSAIYAYRTLLDNGALVVIDQSKRRARILPLR